MKPVSLKERVRDNAQVQKGTRDNSEILKKGTPLTHKFSTSTGLDRNKQVKIGVSKGVTKNMDNYESLRVDVWLEDYKNDGESINDAFVRIGAIVDEELQSQVNSILDE